MNRIAICPSCGQKNRMPQFSQGKRAICAKCRKRLETTDQTEKRSWPPKSPYNTSNRQGVSRPANSKFNWGFLWLPVIGALFLWLVFENSSSSSSDKAISNRPDNSPSINYPEIEISPAGKTEISTVASRVAPLEILTSTGSSYLVKVVSVDSHETVMTFLFRGGTTVSAKVPIGIYEIRYATGQKWYGPDNLFGPETGYSKIDKPFDFKKTDSGVSGYTITLYKVADGNLKTSRISPSQF